MSGLKYLIDHPQEVNPPEKRRGGIALLAQEGKEKNQGGLPGAVRYIAGRAGTDFLRVGEGVVDAALAPVDLLTGNVDRAKSRFMDSPVDAMRERLEEEYNPGKVAGFIGNVAGGIGQSIGYGLISAIPYAGKPMMYSSIVEQGISSAAEKTGKVGLKEIGYGATVGAIEGTLESKLGAGVNAAKGIGSAILKKTGINVAESAAKAGGKSLLKTLAIDTAKGFAGEFGEEFASEAVDPKLQNIWGIDKNAKFSFKDSAMAGIIGGISGGAISVGPSVINYRSAVSVGRALQDSRLDGELIKRARYTLSALEAAQTRSTGQIKGKPAGDTKETAKERLSRTSENRRIKRLSKETAELADKIRRNIQAYENSLKDPAMATSDPVAAILGELRGNLFLVGYAYEADVIEQVMMEADDKQRQAFVDAVNEMLAAQGKKHDYTLADFDANKDDIRRGLAGRMMMDELQGDTAEYGAEASQKPAQAATSPWDGMADNEDMSGYKAAGEAEEALLKAAVNENVPRGSVQAMLDEYRKGTDLTPEDFASGWSDGVHLIGRYGLKVDETAESAYNRLPQSAREAATRIGRETEEAERKTREEKAKAKKKPAAQAGKKGTVVRGEGLNVQKLSDEQYAAYKVAEVLAEVLGTDIVIETKILAKNGKEANGFYDQKTNTIHININALRNGKNIALYTLGHEITHYIKEWSPTKFEALADFVLEQMGVDAETAIADKLASLKRLDIVKDTMTIAEANAIAREELVAEGMELVLTDGKVLEELAKTDKSLWEKIRDWIFDIIGQIRRSWQDLNQASKTAQVLKETVESLDEIERLFTEGVTEAGERTRTAGVETRDDTSQVIFYSANEKNDSVEEQLRENQYLIQDMDPVADITYNVVNKQRARLDASDIFREAGYKVDRQGFGIIEIGENQLSDSTRYLNNPAEFAAWMCVPKVLKRGRVISGHKNHKDRGYPSITIAAPVVINGKRGDVAVVVQQKGKNKYHVHRILMPDGSRFEYENTKNAESTGDSIVGKKTNKRLSIDSASNDSITQPEDPVNRKFSISEENYSEIRYSTEGTTDWESAETPDVSGNPFEEAVRRANLSHLLEGNTDSATAEAERSNAKAILFTGSDEMKRQLIQDHIALANAMMSEARNQDEYEIAKNYRAKAEELSDLEVNLVGLRKMTNALNKDIDALREKAKKYDDETRPEWLKRELERSQAQKTVWLVEMDALKEKISDEKHKLLAITAAHPFGNLIAEYVKTADAMVRSAERTKQREAERIKAVREKSRKEVYKAKRDATEYKNAVYRKAYEKANAKVVKARDEYKQREQYKSDRREMSVRERVARRVVGRMNTMFYNPTKTKHVPADLQALVEAVLKSEKLDTFKETRKNLRQMAEMESEIEKLEQNPARTAKEQEKLDKLHYKYAMYEDEGMDAKSQAVALYTAFKEWMERKPEDQRDKGLLEMMSDDIDAMQDMPLSVMSMKSLEAVEHFYKEIYHQVNTANQAFATEKAANIDQMSTKANTQVKDAKELKFLSPKAREWAALAGVRSFLWKNMKPLTVFEAIGSDELMSIFRRVLDGEDVWITDILEAKKVLDEAKKEFGYNKWNLKERREVTTADGSKVSLTIGEMMSLYAYNFREQAEEHLSAGGFVFAPNAEAIESFKGDKGKYRTHLNDQTPHRMRKADIAKMSELLTEEQRAYAKRVQEYLTSLGKKGNEVSSKLYGIDLFKETAYFPIKSSHDYIETSTGKSGDPNIKSRGTFKETVPKAGNPIVLEDFMEVVGNHVNTMAIYHAFVLPVEDLTRVWNYTPVNIKRDADGKAILDDNGMPVADTEGEAGYNSLKAEITKKYGKEANDYILQLLRDLNGGARRESAASILDKGLTAFKRSATMLSLSTIVQQPTSIIRAMAYVDAKHFTGASFVPWETVKKYAPVAAIKEMGGFDTGTGARTTEYINAKEYDSIKDAAKAAVTPEIYGGDPNVRAEAFGWLTGKADEVSWRYMFGAIVNEQAERLGKPKDSEAVLKAAGERFAEVVRRTQVYDSTLTRSEYMRSKDGLMKMATAFGAEPTTVVSMVVDAIIRAERGDKTFLRKSAAGIAFSVIANAAVASLIYAMRDDDEDETIPEKYVQSLTSELIEGFNPLEYLPIARDVMSLFKGYEIERSDMALVGNLMDQVELITSSKRSVPDKIFGVTGAVSAFFGLPVTNVYRDLKGLVKTGQSFTNAEEQTGAGFGFAMGDAVSGQFNLFAKLFGAESGNAYELYTAYVRGDTAHYERVKNRYKTDQEAEMALRTELRENDKRINQAAWAKQEGDLAVYESIVDQIEAEGIFDRGIVVRAVNNEVSEIKREIEKDNLVPKDEDAAEDEEETPEALYTSSDLNAALTRGDTDDFDSIYNYLLSAKVEQGKTEAQAKAALKSSITSYWKTRYVEAWSQGDEAERKRILSMLTETGLYGTYNDTAKTVEKWVRES